MTEEIKKAIDLAVEALKTQVAEKTANFNTLEEKTAKLIQEAEEKMKTASEAEIKSIKDDFTARVDALVAQMKEKQNNQTVKTFASEFATALEGKSAEIDKISKSNGLQFELKDVTIETSTSITGQAVGSGGAVINQGGSVVFPTPLVNFNNLVRTVPGSLDTIRMWRETATANAIARQSISPTVVAKPEQNLTIPSVDYTASYLAGIFRFHKSMLRNLPWMQARLPEVLRRNYLKAENAEYFTTLKNEATTYTGSLVGVEALVDSIGRLENADYPVNGIVLNPRDWASISIVKSTEGVYSLPGTVVFANGQLTVNGVPVYKASFMPINNFFVGDWTQAYKYVTDGLNVELFEQDVDNVQKNAITARVEESNVLVIEQPDAFIWGELDGATPSV